MTPGTWTDRLRVAMAVFLGMMTVVHVLRPRMFVALIPGWVPGDADLVHAAATAAEGASAVLLARRRTARLGGWLAALTFVGVFPANVDAAIRGGYEQLDGWAGSATAAWLRLPLQLPLVAAAVHVARRFRDGPEGAGTTQATGTDD